MTIDLPDDILSLIFIALPATTLGIIKVVCKRWCSLIDAGFLVFHIQRSVQVLSNHHFIVNAYNNTILHRASFPSFKNPRELSYPFKNADNRRTIILGSCRGLLCMGSYNGRRSSIYFYNPTTQSHFILPNLPRTDPFNYPEGRCDFGLGYDIKSKDYKCVRVCMNQRLDDGGCFECEVHVYSLNSRAWKNIAITGSYVFYYYGGSACVENNINWIGLSSDNLYKIVSFDLCDESVKSIFLPPNLKIEDVHHMFLGVLDKCLSLSINYVSFCDIWFMKEHGVWIWLHRVMKAMDDERIKAISMISRKNKIQLVIEIVDRMVVCIDLTTMQDIGAYDYKGCSVCVDNCLLLKDNSLSLEEEVHKEQK